jgi:hypothetical protein
MRGATPLKKSSASANTTVGPETVTSATNENVAVVDAQSNLVVLRVELIGGKKP